LCKDKSISGYNVKFGSQSTSENGSGLSKSRRHVEVGAAGATRERCLRGFRCPRWESSRLRTLSRAWIRARRITEVPRQLTRT